jgi:L-alanine-DL-glutamate epimerase-like enolase superfamily enzyme
MPAVSIERIEAIALRIPMDHWAPPPLFAGRPRTTIDTLLVRVTTNRDVVGWGEAFGGGWQATVAALDHWVSPLALGQDATDAGLTSSARAHAAQSRACRTHDPCHQRA